MMLIQLLNDIKKTYGLELVGEDLGNFHIDFSMDKSNSEIYAIESLFLGKKTYIDILESTDKHGNTINSEHIRMKGIPTPCIKYYSEQNNINVLDVYKQLYDNKSITFDLTNYSTKFVCRNNKDHSVSSLKHGSVGSTRKCQYIREKDDKIFVN